MDKTLVCRHCNVLPQRVRVEGNADRIRCPRCGVETLLDIATKAAVRHASRSIIKNFQDSMVRSTRGLKHVKCTPGKLSGSQVPDFVFR